MKQKLFLTGILILAFSNTPIIHVGPIAPAKCESNEIDCLCETDKTIEACRENISAAEEKARIKSLFGYPSNRYTVQDPANNNSCGNSHNCMAYLKTLKTIESEYQACQYAKKNITEAQDKKVRKHMNSMGMYPGIYLDTHMRNRQSDELRWLICNYIVACENGLTLYGQETKSLCQ